MFARVSTYGAGTGSEGSDRILEGFRSVSDRLEQMDGFSHAYFLVDRDGGKALSITLWESEEALTASVAKADEIRKEGTEAGGGSIKSVEHYEVGFTVGTPTTDI